MRVSQVIGPIRGVCRVPGDKSISHRAAILAALAEGTSLIQGFSPARDCLATLEVLAVLGVRAIRAGDEMTIKSTGPGTLVPPPGPLHCRRSGTTMRLMAGVLAGRPFRSVLTGDPQLVRRPMDRVAEPLRSMGADVELAPGGGPCVAIRGGGLKGIEYRLRVASAQVKSAVLLAGLQASGVTTVVEATPARDHTERLLAFAGAEVDREGSNGTVRTSIRPGPLRAFDLEVPGDLSSAAPLIAAAALVPGSDLLIEGVGLNPTRTGFLRVLQRMGLSVEIDPSEPGGPEPSGHIRVCHGHLAAVEVGSADVPGVIDELPLLGLLATQAEGVTVVRGARELRVKESDRIAGLVAGLRALGAEAEELEDGFAVRGPTPLAGASCDANGDHRLAMTFAVAGLVASGPVSVLGMEFVPDSFPGFRETLEGLR